jgi:hypothetical protein
LRSTAKIVPWLQAGEDAASAPSLRFQLTRPVAREIA